MMEAFFIGAKDEIRTRDPNLGKVVLYQLSYFRLTWCKYREKNQFLKLFFKKVDREISTCWRSRHIFLFKPSIQS